jgi:hypothetical protein
VKTEAEIREALRLNRWLIRSNRIHRQDLATQMNVCGVVAALEWALGLARPGDDPVGETMADILEMIRRDEGN